jgi:hypothetical protein
MVSLLRVPLTEPNTMELAVWGHGWLNSGTGLRVHKPPVAVDCVPVRTTVCTIVTVTWCAVKMMVHQWSQRLPIERRECDLRDGNAWVRWALGDRPGMDINPVWLILTHPLGRE